MQREHERLQQAAGTANVALCLHRIGEDGPLRRVLAGELGRQAATYAVEWISLVGTRTSDLMRLWSPSETADFKYYFLLAIAELRDGDVDRLFQQLGEDWANTTPGVAAAYDFLRPQTTTITNHSNRLQD